MKYIILQMSGGNVTHPLKWVSAPVGSAGANFFDDQRHTMFSAPHFVQSGQVFMCRFEDCWDSANAQICANKSIIANIKPEIGKVRPVVVMYPYKHIRQAVVIPFTTQTPFREAAHTVFIPQGFLPGVLAKKECWALCNMLKTVALDRLQLPFSGQKNLRIVYRNLRLDNGKFNEIRMIVKNLF